MRQTSRILTAILSVGTFLLVHTVCKPCHGMMTMPCERSTTAAGLVLALVLLSDILSFVILRAIANRNNDLQSAVFDGGAALCAANYTPSAKATMWLWRLLRSLQSTTCCALQ